MQASSTYIDQFASDFLDPAVIIISGFPMLGAHFASDGWPYVPGTESPTRA